MVVASVVFPIGGQVNRSIQDTERVLDILRALTWTVDLAAKIFIIKYNQKLSKIIYTDYLHLIYTHWCTCLHIEYRHCLPFVLYTYKYYWRTSEPCMQCHSFSEGYWSPAFKKHGITLQHVDFTWFQFMKSVCWILTCTFLPIVATYFKHLQTSWWIW